MFQTYGFQPSEYGAAKPSKAAKKGTPKKAPPARKGQPEAKAKAKMPAAGAGGKGGKVKKGEPVLTKTQVASLLKKHKFLRDENEKLAVAFSTQNLPKAWEVWASLAKQRDKLKRHGIAESQGKTLKEVAGRAYAGVVTLGASELILALNKKKVSKARKKRAAEIFEKSKAAADLLRFWRKEFDAEAARLRVKSDSELNPAQKKMLASLKSAPPSMKMVEVEGSMAAESEKPPTKEEAAKEAEALSEVESEAPKAAVEAEAKSEDKAAVSAPIASDAEVAAAKEGAASAEAPAAEAAAAEGGEVAKAEGAAEGGMSTNMKIGIAAGIGLAALLLLRR